MNLVWFFVIILLVLFLVGCAAILSRMKDPPPDVIIIITDVHGNKKRYALDHLKGLKIIISQKIKYEFEYMLEEELNLGNEKQHKLRN